MKIVFVIVIALLFSPSVLMAEGYAEDLGKCEYLNAPDVPNGLAETTAKMLAVQKEVKSYLKSAEQYLACLVAVEKNWSKDITAEGKRSISILHNKVVDEMEDIAKRFNTALRTHRSQEYSRELSIDELLVKVKAARAEDAVNNKKREVLFLAERNQQIARIKRAEKELIKLQAVSFKLEKRFDANQQLIEDKRQQRDMRLAALKELFGHFIVAAGDLRSRFEDSITSSQFPDREVFLSELIKKMNSDSDFPTLEEFKRLWFELHREMTESGRIVKYRVTVDKKKEREVVRIGLFNLVSDGDYLAYDPDTGRVSAYPRQPVDLGDNALLLQSSSSGITPVGIDPTGAVGGGFLRAIIEVPTLLERWHRGRQIGYIITGIGFFALLVVLWRFCYLAFVSKKIRTQLACNKIETNNPLGRILNVAKENTEADAKSLELKLGEAIFKESAKIQSGLSLLRILAMVAPLLGLLGTVTGMIIVFQAITIYGVGDPKAMAGGISSALVTTVLGLLVAVPTLLLHALLNGKAKKLLHILHVRKADIVAERLVV